MKRHINFAVIRQSEAGECGLACLAMIFSHHGHQISLSHLRNLFPLSVRGASIGTLISISNNIGFDTRAIRCDLSAIENIQLPALIHWELNHYVVLNKIKSVFGARSFQIADPAKGLIDVDEKKFSDSFTGIILELTPKENLIRQKSRNKIGIFDFFTNIKGLFSSAYRILLLSIITQIILLVTPLYLQMNIDAVVPSQDTDLAKVLVFGFAGVALLGSASSWLRSLIILNLSTTLSHQIAINLFRHLVYISSSWFHKRHVGDVVSRFNSLQPISDFISKGFISSIVDGILGAITLIILFIFSQKLAMISCALILIYIALKALLYFKSVDLNFDILNNQAQENSIFLETIRGIGTIKLFCKEENRRRTWGNRKSQTVSHTLTMARTNTAYEVVSQYVISLENIVVIFFAVNFVMDGEFTIGMIFSYQIYKQNFVSSSSRLVDAIINFKLLDVHLNRISDIVLTPTELTEKNDNISIINNNNTVKTLSISNVYFQYGYNSPFILNKLDFQIAAGEVVAVIGPTGVGKSTFVKVICGSLSPSSGDISIDGVPIENYGPRRYRGLLGVVSQEDVLFAGSILDNVSFFDLDPDIKLVEDCCRLACIHNDIVAMPLRYDTLVGDMGSSLSGGQKQRLLLARALYRKPWMLVLDEGTAHLDIVTEMQISDSLFRLGIARLIIAHRPETIKIADRVLLLRNGRLEEVSDHVKSIKASI